MTKRPRPPDDLPAGNGQPRPAAAPRPPAADCPDAAPAAPLAAVLASRWAVILKRFRDYMHQQ
jgi:hypothetical protein